MLVVVTDIFGRTPELDDLCASLQQDTLIVDPYQGIYRAYENEATAYSTFSRDVGLDHYCEHLLETLALINEAYTIIGFSVGAAAVWRCSDKMNSNQVSLCVGYYGSQIRNALEVTPAVPCELIFPHSEAHFCVDSIIEVLTHTPRVSIEKREGLHGFMNRCSVNYDDALYQAEVNRLRQLLTKQQ